MELPYILRTLDEEQTAPYFFKNENIDNNIYIVQRCHNVGNALFIIDTWNREGKNIITTDIEIYVDHTYYIYNGNDNITKVNVSNDGKESSDYKIIIYKKNGKVYTSALLLFAKNEK